MIKIKTAEFFSREYDGPKYKVILVSFLGSLCFSLVLVIANTASEIIAHAGQWIKIGLLLAFMVICATSIFCKRYTLNRTTTIAQQVVRKVRVQLIDKLRHTELQFIEQKGKGEIYARIVQDTELLSHALPNLLSSVEAGISAVIVLGYMAYISMTGFILALSSLLVMNAIFFSKYVKIKDTLRTARAKEGDYSDALDGVLSGFKEIRINTRKNNDLFADIGIIARESERLKTEAELNHDKNVVLAIFLSQIVLGVMVFIVPQYSPAYGHVIAELVASVLFLFGLTGMAMGGIYTITRANVAVENLEKLEEEIDAFGARAAGAGMQEDSAGGFRQITFPSLAFHYTAKDGGKGFSIGPLDLTINRGEVVFVVGGNGSGKSTLLKLLTGLYYPEGSPILLDGRPVTAENYPAYRGLFSTIFTDFHLFKKLYGLESIDEERVTGLLGTMNLQAKTDYADGRFTRLNLSTGQRKRLAYIVALLGDKDIYVFDEWAADQDPEFRRYFYERFMEDLRIANKTVVAATHDDRFFNRADRIIEMEEGRVAEDRRNPYREVSLIP
jgi:putative ATP-binding cassette transporter